MNIELRDYFAGKALQGIMSDTGVNGYGFDSWAELLGTVAEDAYALADAMLAAREAGKPKEDGDGWIEWDGGECPVDSDMRVEVEMFSGETEIQPANQFRWNKAGYLGDIIAYRVLK